MTVQTFKCLLVENSDQYCNYDDSSVVTRLIEMDNQDPFLWILTRDEINEYEEMFRSNYRKYNGYHFVPLICPDSAPAVNEMQRDLDEFRAAAKKREDAEKKAERARKAKAEEKRLAKERAKFAADEVIRKQLYAELKQEFEKDA